MKIAAVIPARRASSRFPAKPLAPILGRPMILWVAELAARAIETGPVFVATDDPEIAHTVRNAGFECVMTGSALTGTDRVAEAAEQIDADLLINIQGDEPLLNVEDIRRVVLAKQEHPKAVANGMCPMGAQEDPCDPNIPKVAWGFDHRLVYMSRLPVPGSKNPQVRASPEHWKQVCVYAFDRKELALFRSLGRRGLVEGVEDIEILRFLELGHPVRMVETTGGSLAVDRPEDVGKVEAAMRARGIA